MRLRRLQSYVLLLTLCFHPLTPIKRLQSGPEFVLVTCLAPNRPRSANLTAPRALRRKNIERVNHAEREGGVPADDGQEHSAAGDLRAETHMRRLDKRALGIGAEATGFHRHHHSGRTPQRPDEERHCIALGFADASSHPPL